MDNYRSNDEDKNDPFILPLYKVRQLVHDLSSCGCSCPSCKNHEGSEIEKFNRQILRKALQ